MHSSARRLTVSAARRLTRAATPHARALSSAARAPAPAATAASGAPTFSTVNAAEIAHFSRLSSAWWDERGEFGMLHRMNPVRVQFVCEKVAEAARDGGGEAAAPSRAAPLAGLDVLDVGCGGGLLSEALARLGARTTAIDASAANIAIAQTHSAADPVLSGAAPAAHGGTLQYMHTSAEALAERAARFDVVCSMEVVEHVDNPAAFLRTCADLVKPGGHLFLSTIARTPMAYLATIVAAERVLGVVSPGTHTFAKYINPSELVDFFAAHRSAPDARPWISAVHAYNQSVLPSSAPSRHEAEVRGMLFQPWSGEWTLAPRSASYGLASWLSQQMNYIFWVRKPADAE